MMWWKRELTPGEIEERDAKARARMKRREEKAAQREAAQRQSNRRSTLMTRAAGISRVQLVCHPDTWQYLRARCAQRTGWPKEVSAESREDGLIEVTLSGHQLTYVVLVTRPDESAFRSYTDKAMCSRIFDSVIQVIDHVEYMNDKGAPVPPIVIDDQPAAA